MRIHRRTIFASTAGALLSISTGIAVLCFENWDTMLLSVAIGVFFGSLVALLISASVYRSQRHALFSEMLILIAQAKGVCNRINRAEGYTYPDKVDLLLQSYHTIKNCYSLLIKHVLDFDPVSRRLARRVVLLSEEIHMLEVRLKDQLRMSAPTMKKTYPDLIDSLPLDCLESMEKFIADRVFNLRQRQLYHSVDHGMGGVLDAEQYVAGVR